MVYYETVELSTGGNTDIKDITEYAGAVTEGSKIQEGQLSIYVAGSTAGLTSIEYEPGLVKDLRDAWQKIAPTGVEYYHDAAWGDGNGYAHVRAALLKSSFHAPVHEGRIILGTWQQIVLVDFDNRPRRRTISFQVIGEI